MGRSGSPKELGGGHPLGLEGFRTAIDKGKGATCARAERENCLHSPRHSPGYTHIPPSTQDLGYREMGSRSHSPGAGPGADAESLPSTGNSKGKRSSDNLKACERECIAGWGAGKNWAEAGGSQHSKPLSWARVKLSSGQSCGHWRCRSDTLRSCYQIHETNVHNWRTGQERARVWSIGTACPTVPPGWPPGSPDPVPRSGQAINRLPAQPSMPFMQTKPQGNRARNTERGQTKWTLSLISARSRPGFLKPLTSHHSPTPTEVPFPREGRVPALSFNLKPAVLSCPSPRQAAPTAPTQGPQPPRWAGR